jgi:hypothetical protein
MKNFRMFMALVFVVSYDRDRGTFQVDDWRIKTKGSKGSKGKNRKIQYYINYPLLIDGVHPSELLSKLWLRRICKKVAQLCY